MTINVLIRYNNCIKYKKIGKNSQRISRIKPFIDKNNWKGINCPSEKDDQKIFEKKPI